MRKFVVAGLAAFAMAVPGMSGAVELVTAKFPQTIFQIARGYGSAELSKDASGDPRIIGRINGIKYGIYFYGCTNGENCVDIQFLSSWSGASVSQSDMNDWNRTRRFGKAYLDREGDPVLEMSVNLDQGVTKENLEKTFEWWSRITTQFKKDKLGQ
ncbi:YbjN domain-containing protein [Sphaerotilus uruguayifluvii]|uniref:YbjN domain-containing protein n=1 Tax=Sphaerotilus uruguayifluvii TaxID=2735897 RepID=A0ABX2G4I6_9BURK|nr:YbjN domain-containing protein [Leptothrix sp. C29]NRT57212.1 hypothetical protein [Leptothrix sp. C29]